MLASKNDAFSTDTTLDVKVAEIKMLDASGQRYLAGHPLAGRHPLCGCCAHNAAKLLFARKAVDTSSRDEFNSFMVQQSPV